MAVIDTSVLKIDSGNYFIAPEGTAKPVDLGAPADPWEPIGHTSLEDILASEAEGGEATILGTLQKKALRTTYSPRTESFIINLQQFDEDSLKLYYGSNTIAVEEGLLGVPNTSSPTIMAWCALYWDGVNVFGLYAPKAEIIRQENLTLENTEALASLPLKITPVNYNTNQWALGVLPIRDLTPAP